MDKISGYVTVKVEMYAESAEDWADTLESTFALPLPHLISNKVFASEITSDIPDG